MNSIETAFFGRLGSDPELRTSQAGKTWLKLSIAVGEADATQWVSVAVFGEKAEQLAGTLHKGDRCYCEGTLKLQTWTDQAGNSRSGLSVAAWRCQRLGEIGRNKPAKPKANTAARDWQRPKETDSRPANGYAAAEDSIPF